MARFDLYRAANGGFVIDCQADRFQDIGTRFVIPLVPRGSSAPPEPRLNPSIEVNGERLVMMTQFATAVRSSELKARVMSLRDHDLMIQTALDVLTGSA